jgi:O-antigen/teichoic acid export membrane protein
MKNGSSILRSILVVLGSSWLAFLINIVRVMIVPAQLGEQGMGQVTLAWSFTGFFYSLMLLGTSNYLVRAVARDEALLDRYVSNALVLRAGTGLLGLALMTGTMTLFGYSALTQQVILIAALTVLVMSFSNVFESGLQAIGQITWRTMAVAIGNAVSVAMGISLLLLGADIVVYMFCSTAGLSLQLAIASAYFVFKRPIKLGLHRPVMRDLLVGGMPLFLWAFLQSLYAGTDATVLSLLAGEEVIGWYGLARQFAGVLVMIPIAVNTVALPMLCELYVKSVPQFRRFAVRTITSVLLLFIPAAAGLALAGPDLIRAVDSHFIHAAPALALMAICLPVTGVLMLMGSLSMAIGLEKTWVKISAVGVVVIPPLYVGLGWWFQNGMANGATGIALAGLIGEASMLVAAWFILPKELRLPELLPKVRQITAATGVMAVVVLALQSIQTSIFVYVPVAVAVYALCAWLMRLITPEEFETLRSAILRRRARGNSEIAEATG